jgi:hypothetical protein
MEPSTARNIAHSAHTDQRTRSGFLLVEHLERVAASAPAEAQTVAYLHDVLEHTATSISELEALGLTALELAAVRLLTRGAAESFEAHALRIAHAHGSEGRLARAVKLADIEDHLEQERGAFSTRPYGWARRHIVACQARLDPVTAPAA